MLLPFYLMEVFCSNELDSDVTPYFSLLTSLYSFDQCTTHLPGCYRNSCEKDIYDGSQIRCQGHESRANSEGLSFNSDIGKYNMLTERKLNVKPVLPIPAASGQKG